jgi:hypothetical protein
MDSLRLTGIAVTWEQKQQSGGRHSDRCWRRMLAYRKKVRPAEKTVVSITRDIAERDAEILRLWEADTAEKT